MEAFIDHISNLFDPDDGTVLIPECFGMIDVMRHSVSFESTSSHLGRSLTLRRQDNRIGPKQLIVIVEEISKDKKSEPKEKTQLLTKFLLNRGGFKEDEILYLSESEAYEIENLLN